MKTALIVPSPDDTEEMVGANDTIPAAPNTAALCNPVPRAFTARRTTLYVLPLLSPVITSGLVVDTGLRVVHVEPLLRENW